MSAAMGRMGTAAAALRPGSARRPSAGPARRGSRGLRARAAGAALAMEATA